MKAFDISPLAMLKSVWSNRYLASQLTRREIMGRYNGSIFGIVWSFFTPVLMLTIYTFVFSVIFKARWPGGTGSKTEFAILLFVGMIVFSIFSECVSRAPEVVIGSPNYVKKVVFPLDIFPWAILGAALFHAAISLFVLLIFCLLVGQTVPLTWLAIPVILLPLILLTLGLCWFLSALAVYLRDVAQTVGLMVTVLMFLSPVFYSLDALPENFRTIASMNPLAFIIESARDAMIWGLLPDVVPYTLNLSVGMLFACLGFAWFQKTRKGFGDVL
jgi:lipopolysaccharide transport system permease protein